MNLKFRAGWMISDCSSAQGGIQYAREQLDTHAVNAGSGLRIGHRTTQTVDNVEFCAAVDACVKRVDYVLRKHCARTAMGWFADADALKRVKAEIVGIQEEAADLNAQAEKQQSARHAKVVIVPLRADFSQIEFAQEVITTIQDVLIELHAALRTGELALLHKLRIRAKNIERLLEGTASTIVAHALDRVPEAANEIRRHIRWEAAAQIIAAEKAVEALKAAAAAKKAAKKAAREGVDPAPVKPAKVKPEPTKPPKVLPPMATPETVDLSALEHAISMMASDYVV